MILDGFLSYVTTVMIRKIGLNMNGAQLRNNDSLG